MSQLVAVREARTGAELLSRYSATHARLWAAPGLAVVKREPIQARTVYASVFEVGPRRPLPNLKAIQAALDGRYDEARAMTPKAVRIADILYAVVDHFGVSKRTILSARRSRSISRPRQVAMFLAKELTYLSLPQIGRQFGKDHTTVIHGARKIAELVANGDPIAADVAAIRGRLCLI
jgi:hypothetical protein